MPAKHFLPVPPPDDDTLRHVILNTHMAGRQRILQALPVNTRAKSGCAAAPVGNTTLI
jgi:hypothetical protein